MQYMESSVRPTTPQDLIDNAELETYSEKTKGMARSYVTTTRSITNTSEVKEVFTTRRKKKRGHNWSKPKGSGSSRLRALSLLSPDYDIPRMHIYKQYNDFTDLDSYPKIRKMRPKSAIYTSRSVRGYSEKEKHVHDFSTTEDSDNNEEMEVHNIKQKLDDIDKRKRSSSTATTSFTTRSYTDTSEVQEIFYGQKKKKRKKLGHNWSRQKGRGSSRVRSWSVISTDYDVSSVYRSDMYTPYSDFSNYSTKSPRGKNNLANSAVKSTAVITRSIRTTYSEEERHIDGSSDFFHTSENEDNTDEIEPHKTGVDRLITPDLLVPAFSVPYNDNIEEEFAKRERHRSLSTARSYVSSSRSYSDTSEVQKIFSRRRRSSSSLRTSLICTRSISRAQNNNNIFCTVENCNMYSDNVDEMNLHNIKEHEMAVTYFCHECVNEYTTELLFNLHKNNHDFSFFCLMCGIEQDNSYKLQKHLKEHMIYSAPCKYCDKSFLTKSSTDEHVRKCHSGKRKRRIFKNRLILARIDKNDDDYVDGYNNQEDIHDNPSKIFCSMDNCPAFNYNIEDMNCHNKQVHNMSKSYYCHECLKGFTTKDLFYLHQKYHDFSFFCLMCGIEQRNSLELQRHLDQHNIFSVPCNYCDKSFLSEDYREKHTRKCRRGKTKKPDYVDQLILARIDKNENETELGNNFDSDTELEDLLDVTIENLQMKDIDVYIDEDEQNTDRNDVNVKEQQANDDFDSENEFEGNLDVTIENLIMNDIAVYTDEDGYNTDRNEVDQSYNEEEQQTSHGFDSNNGFEDNLDVTHENLISEGIPIYTDEDLEGVRLNDDMQEHQIENEPDNIYSSDMEIETSDMDLTFESIKTKYTPIPEFVGKCSPIDELDVEEQHLLDYEIPATEHVEIQEEIIEEVVPMEAIVET